MALGGGTFLTQNKKLPGVFMNFVSVARATASLADRGYAALPLELDWGADNKVMTVTTEDLQKNSRKIFGYDYTNEKLKGLRDLFKNIHTAYIYKLMKNGVAATNTYGSAVCKGIRGNDLKLVISANVDDVTKFDVSIYLGSSLVDEQLAVGPKTDDLADNNFVKWKKGVVLEASAGTPFTAGSNGEPVEGAEHQEALAELEPYSFNALGCLSTVETIKDLYIAFNQRLRDQVGAKFQTVVHKKQGADYEGVVSVLNDVTDDDNEASLAYWSTGATAGCAINRSNTNKKYDGEYEVKTKIDKTLEMALSDGDFVFHKVGDDICVLEDINTFTSFTNDKNEDFSSNQTIRVLDQIGNDIARLFAKKYLGKEQNDAAGRISLWNDITTHHKELQTLRAIENFKSEDVTVQPGNLKKAVVVTDYVQPTNAMAQLYMTVMVS